MLSVFYFKFLFLCSSILTLLPIKLGSSKADFRLVSIYLIQDDLQPSDDLLLSDSSETGNGCSYLNRVVLIRVISIHFGIILGSFAI